MFYAQCLMFNLMSQPAIYIAVTSHGFGHAVRAATVAEKLRQLRPDVTLILVTVAPQWLLQSYLEGDFVYRQRVFDVGAIQSDSLTIDRSATLTKMESIIVEEATIIAEEVAYIRDHNVQLILADIPALAAPIARAAGIPCWMMSNFAWDYIYRDWGEDFAEIVAWLENHYGQSDRLFRLPLAEPMTAFPHVTPTGLTGATPRYRPEEIRQQFNLTAPPAKTLLLTFGGLGVQDTPYENLQDFPDWEFITFDRNAPDLANLLKVTDNRLRPLDFMPICGRVFSKPGYSTFSEALCCDLPIISLTRDGFAEAEVLLTGIKDYAYHQIVSVEDFFTPNWDFLRQELTPPLSRDRLAKDGAETIAQAIADYL